MGLALLLPLTAGAQSSDNKRAEAREEKSRDGRDEDRGGAEELTREEQQTRVESMLAEMRDALRRVTDLLGEANASKDIVQLNCVNEKLTQVKGLLRVSEESATKMYEAIASNMMDAVAHEYTKVSVAHQKVSVLRAEAEQCVGEFSVYTGDTEVTVEVDNDIPEVDSTIVDPPPPGPEVPPVASAS